MSDQNLVQACTFLTVPMRTKPQLYVYSPRFYHPNDTYISPHYANFFRLLSLGTIHSLHGFLKHSQSIQQRNDYN